MSLPRHIRLHGRNDICDRSETSKLDILIAVSSWSIYLISSLLATTCPAKKHERKKKTIDIAIFADFCEGRDILIVDRS